MIINCGFNWQGKMSSNLFNSYAKVDKIINNNQHINFAINSSTGFRGENEKFYSLILTESCSSKLNQIFNLIPEKSYEVLYNGEDFVRDIYEDSYNKCKLIIKNFNKMNCFSSLAFLVPSKYNNKNCLFYYCFGDGIFIKYNDKNNFKVFDIIVDYKNPTIDDFNSSNKTVKVSTTTVIDGKKYFSMYSKSNTFFERFVSYDEDITKYNVYILLNENFKNFKNVEDKLSLGNIPYMDIIEYIFTQSTFSFNKETIFNKFNNNYDTSIAMISSNLLNPWR